MAYFATKKPDDFVIATGRQFSVKYFINIVAKELSMKITWKGKGLNEKAYDQKNNVIIECNKNTLDQVRFKHYLAIL